MLSPTFISWVSRTWWHMLRNIDEFLTHSYPFTRSWTSLCSGFCAHRNGVRIWIATASAMEQVWRRNRLVLLMETLKITRKASPAFTTGTVLQNNLQNWARNVEVWFTFILLYCFLQTSRCSTNMYSASQWQVYLWIRIELVNTWCWSKMDEKAAGIIHFLFNARKWRDTALRRRYCYFAQGIRNKAFQIVPCCISFPRRSVMFF